MTPHPLLRRAALLCAFVCFSFFVRAADTDIKAFNLPAGPAEKTLRQYSEQSGVQVIYPTDTARGVETKEVRGNFTASEALDQMLAGTPLVGSRNEKSGILTVHREATPEIAAKNGNRAIASDSDRPRKNQRTDENAEGEKVIKLDTFEVFGQKTLNMDIQRTREDIQPYVVFDHQTIENSGATNLEDFLRTRLPMNTQQTSNSQISDGSGGTLGNNQSSINLRGLGSNQTLILVDGRRMPSVNSLSLGSFAGSLGQPDINGIPISFVERIDVLPSTASGIYGGGATGGVINIVLKKKYYGVELLATYGNTTDGSSESHEFAVTGGFAVENGNTQVMFSADFKDSTPLLSGSRDFTDKSVAKALIDSPSLFYNISPPPSGFLPNILSATLVGGVRQPLVLDSGAALNSTYTTIPSGYQGVLLDGGAALLARAGTYSLNSSNDYNAKVGRLRSLINTPRAKSFNLSFRRQFGSLIDAFIDASWFFNSGSTINSGQIASGGAVTLAANAPNNPFQQAIIVSVPTPGLPVKTSKTDSATTRIAGGATVRLPHGWQSEIDYTWSQSETKASFSPIRASDLSAAGTNALADGTLDYMRDVNVYPVNYASYFVSEKLINDPLKTTLHDITLRLGGPVIVINNNPVVLSGSFNYRKDEAEESYIQIPATIGSTLRYLPARSQDVNSIYMEGKHALISDNNGIPFVKLLEVQIAVRRESYSTKAPNPSFVDVADRAVTLPTIINTKNRARSDDITAGLKWTITPDISVRASAGTGFLPPSVNQLIQTITPRAPSLVPLFNIKDPKRANTVVGRDALGNLLPITSFTAISGGNANLLPEQSRSASVGAVITPRIIKGLRVSVDYTRIKKSGEIAALTSQQVVNAEESLPGRVTRGQNLASDLPGWAGPIIGLDTSLVNVTSRYLDAFDIQADYVVTDERVGTLQFYAIGTEEMHYRGQLTEATPVVDDVGFTNGPLKWRGNVGATLQHGHITLGWNMQYYASYLNYSSSDTPSQIASTVMLQGGDRVPSQRYHDVFIRYTTGHSSTWLWNNMDISVQVQNVFNTEPPILAGLTASYSNYGDPRLRRYTLSLRKKL